MDWSTSDMISRNGIYIIRLVNDNDVDEHRDTWKYRAPDSVPSHR